MMELFDSSYLDEILREYNGHEDSLVVLSSVLLPCDELKGELKWKQF